MLFVSVLHFDTFCAATPDGAPPAVVGGTTAAVGVRLSSDLAVQDCWAWLTGVAANWRGATNTGAVSVTCTPAGVRTVSVAVRPHRAVIVTRMPVIVDGASVVPCGQSAPGAKVQ